MAFILGFVAMSCQQSHISKAPVQLIIDTDFAGVDGDLDDTRALALAHGLMSKDECDFKAVILCVNKGRAMQAVDPEIL